jgi:TrmH family RNA methyltransferase
VRRPSRPRPDSLRSAQSRLAESSSLPALSFRHEAVQRLRRLTGRRTTRQAESCFVVEGAKLLEEARAAGARIQAVYLDSSEAAPADRELAASCGGDGAELFELQAGVLARACDTVTPQPIAAIVGTVEISLDDLDRRRPDVVVVCVDVRDPGNLGTIIRSAGAAGADAVVCCAGSVDLFNPKTVRASAGILFHLPVVAAGDAVQVLEELGRWGLRRWGTAAQGDCDYVDADLTVPCALVLGNEARGLAASLEPHLDGTLRIPMAGPAESLNVATAASVLCFEAARQRRSLGGGRW